MNRMSSTCRRPGSWRISAGLLLMVAGLLLGGCGFRMQGASPLPADVGAMSVSYSNDYRVATPPVVDLLRQQLRERDLLGGPGAAAQLRFDRIDNFQRIVSISPVDGRVAEYRLVSEAVFDYRVNGETLLDDQRVRVERRYSFDDTERLAAERERRELLTAMHAELVELVLLRLDTAGA